MPYMYCNQQGCNETVKLPNKYCHNHAPKQATVKLDEFVSTQVEEANTLNTKTNKPKKTTK